MKNTGTQKLNKSIAILDLLEQLGETGMRFSDIQAELWNMSHPRGPGITRALRGYWCTALLGGSHYHRGLLRVYADKGADGRWRRNSVAHEGKPWAKVNYPKAYPKVDHNGRYWA
jgi:hypothetical protein